MKAKSIILALAFLTITVVSVHAQGFQLGAKGGVNLSQIQGRAFDQAFNYGYSLGGYAEINVTKHLGFQPELLWNEYQARTADNANQIYTNLSNGTNIRLNYLSIPLLLSFKPTKIISIQAGPQFGVLIKSSQTFVDNTKSAFKTGDFSMLAGVQLNLGWFKLGGRYVYGLTNSDKVGNLDSWKSQGYQVYVGVRII
ncbi:MAG: PorT family protein [Bacteroidetes bacterium]|nr:PorT family protein [Bacteroidota bacterium]